VCKVDLDERVEGRRRVAVFARESRQFALCVASIADDRVKRAVASRNGDRELPHTRTYLADRSFTARSAYPWQPLLALDDGEVVHAYAARVDRAAAKADSLGERAALEFPGDASSSREPAIDADLRDAVAIGGTEPQAMGAVGLDQRVEPGGQRGHDRYTEVSS
jgi:hypothetical protein